MRKFMRSSVIALTMALCLFPITLRAQDRVPLAAGGAGGTAIGTGVPLHNDGLFDGISPDQTISMDLQEANLRDILKLFSIQSGLNFIASEAVENKKITLYLDKVPIKLAMEKLFDTNKLAYEFDEDAGIFVVRGKEEDTEVITEVFRLKHRSVLTSNMEKQRTGLLASGLATQSSQAGTPAADISDLRSVIQQMLSPVGKVTEDNKTNSLVITDVPGRFPQIRSFIAAIDVPQAQVMLDVEMLDVSKDLVDKLGFNFGSGNPSIALGLTLAGKSLAFPFSSSSLKGEGKAMTHTAGSYSFSNSSIGVTLDLLKRSNEVKMLARPRILTLDNETAEIGITKDEVISATKDEDEDTGDVTWTYERASSLSLTPEGIGVFLRVTPMINEETGEIILIVNPKSSSTTVSDIGDGNNKDPEVRASKSVVKVRDGETIVLGGLIKNDKDIIKRKIPVLGDIPVLGMLFRSKDQSQNIERELLVFITPHIVKDHAAPLSASRGRGPRAPTGANKQRSQANKVTLFTRHEAVNTALNNLDR